MNRRVRKKREKRLSQQRACREAAYRESLRKLVVAGTEHRSLPELVVLDPGEPVSGGEDR